MVEGLFNMCCSYCLRLNSTAAFTQNQTLQLFDTSININKQMSIKRKQIEHTVTSDSYRWNSRDKKRSKVYDVMNVKTSLSVCLFKPDTSNSDELKGPCWLIEVITYLAASLFRKNSDSFIKNPSSKYHQHVTVKVPVFCMMIYSCISKVMLLVSFARTAHLPYVCLCYIQWVHTFIVWVASLWTTSSVFHCQLIKLAQKQTYGKKFV